MLGQSQLVPIHSISPYPMRTAKWLTGGTLHQGNIRHPTWSASSYIWGPGSLACALESICLPIFLYFITFVYSENCESPKKSGLYCHYILDSFWDIECCNNNIHYHYLCVLACMRKPSHSTLTWYTDNPLFLMFINCLNNNPVHRHILVK